MLSLVVVLALSGLIILPIIVIYNKLIRLEHCPIVLVGCGCPVKKKVRPGAELD